MKLERQGAEVARKYQGRRWRRRNGECIGAFYGGVSK